MQALLKRPFFKHWFAAVVFILAGIYITFPLILHLTNFVSGKGDELLLTWILNWNIHSFFNSPLSIFNANIFYPYSNTLAFSDTLFTSSFLAIIPLKSLVEPLVAFNFTLIFSLILLGISVYLLTYHLTKNFLASVISGLLVIFSPPILNETPHLQVIAIYFVPLSILFFLKFLEENKTKYFAITMGLLVLQTYNSFLPGYFIVFSLITIYIFYLFEKRKEAIGLITKKNLLAVFLSLIIIAPIGLPYFKISKEFHYVRDIRDTIHFALQPEDLLYPHPLTRLNPVLMKLFPQTDPDGELKPGFLGLTFTILTIFSLVYFLKRYKRTLFLNQSFVFIAILSFILSLGPFLHFGRHTIHHPFPVPLPYLLFYYFVPGFNGMRNSGRWEILFIIIAAVLAGIFLSNILSRKTLKQNLPLLIIIFAIISEFNFPMKFVEVPGIKNFPKEYYFLRENYTQASTIHMPIYNWDMPPYGNEEMAREYYSTLNYNKMVNGFSGFSPLEWEAMVRNMIVNFPSQETIDKLKIMRVDLVIVHKNEYERMKKDNYNVRGKSLKSGNKVLSEISQYKELKLIKSIGDTYIYKLN